VSETNEKSPNSNGIEDTQKVEVDTWAAEKAKLQEQADKFKNEYLYLRAEFENYKKNSIKERSDLIKFGAERLARDIVGVLDNFERALSLKITPENLGDFSKGVEMTAHELRSTLQKHGIHEFPSEGLPFDPAHHEALSSEVSSSHPEGHVLRVFQKAYKYHDRMIRPAQVVVSKKPEV
jgi:molecular chaperone GrpE